MRRAAATERAGNYAAIIPSAADLRGNMEAGRELRKILVGCYLSEGMSAKKLCHASWYHQQSGGVGLDDLARDPASSGDADHSGHYNAWVRHVLAREHGDASMSLVSTPMHDKKIRVVSKC